jgi:hypothetical protein
MNKAFIEIKPKDKTLKERPNSRIKDIFNDFKTNSTKKEPYR